jgi:hypothetical protein
VQITTRVRRFATGLALALSASLALSTAASPAWADGETEPPVAVDDAYTGYAGGMQSLNVLANDSDPQGAEIAVCKVKAPELADEDFIAMTSGDRIEFFDVRGEARTVTFTYYVCNDEFLTPATVTVTLVAPKPLKVTKLDRPGRLRFTNPNDFRVVVMYGDIRRPAPTGRFRLAAHGSEVVRVNTHRVGYLALGVRNGAVVGSGVIRGIELPQRTAARQATDEPLELPRRIANLWGRLG